MAHSKYDVTTEQMTTHLVEDRRASLSPYGRGNSKLGPGIYTYSKLPGRIMGTCPGSSPECEMICYAKRMVKNSDVWRLWQQNSQTDAVPSPPADAKVIRWHVGGDFNSTDYIRSWLSVVTANPQITFYGYTRSWQVAELLEDLEKLRAMPNVHLWASVDKSMGLPPDGWRRAWIEDDARLVRLSDKRWTTPGGVPAITCPEEAGLIADCETCGFCFKPGVRDLVFLRH